MVGGRIRVRDSLGGILMRGSPLEGGSDGWGEAILAFVNRP